MIVECDRISKLDDLCDYELAQWVVVLLQKMWGRFTIDRCATVHSCKVFSRSGRPMFNSRFATRLSLGGDFRRQFDWAQHFNYVNPPFALIPDAINCVFVQHAQAVLIVPHDSTATWWPILQVGQLGIRDVRTLPVVHGLVSVGGVLLPPTILRAVHIDCRYAE